MRTVVIRSLVVLWAGGLLAFLLAPTASADAINCSAKIVDTTSAHVLDAAKVESAIRTVETHGADVYVRAFENMPGGNADAFWAQGLQQFANPLGHPVNLKHDVVNVLVSSATVELQRQFGTGERRFGPFQLGIGLGDFLRAVAGFELGELFACRAYLRLGLIPLGAGLLITSAMRRRKVGPLAEVDEEG